MIYKRFLIWGVLAYSAMISPIDAGAAFRAMRSVAQRTEPGRRIASRCFFIGGMAGAAGAHALRVTSPGGKDREKMDKALAVATVASPPIAVYGALLLRHPVSTLLTTAGAQWWMNRVAETCDWGVGATIGAVLMMSSWDKMEKEVLKEKALKEEQLEQLKQLGEAQFNRLVSKESTDEK
jgi:hypothetical protein